MRFELEQLISSVVFCCKLIYLFNKYQVSFYSLDQVLEIEPSALLESTTWKGKETLIRYTLDLLVLLQIGLGGRDTCHLHLQVRELKHREVKYQQWSHSQKQLLSGGACIQSQGTVLENTSCQKHLLHRIVVRINGENNIKYLEKSLALSVEIRFTSQC